MGSGAGKLKNEPSSIPERNVGFMEKRRLKQIEKETQQEGERLGVVEDDDDQIVLPKELKDFVESLVPHYAARDLNEEEIELHRQHERATALPWTSAVLEPTEWNQPENMEFAPDESVRLEFVYGFRGRDSLSTLKYTESSVVFSASSLCIVMDAQTRNQRFFREHRFGVTCMALHPDNRTIATGEVCESPTIHVWDSATLDSVNTLGEFHHYGIAALSFSSDGRRLISVGMDENHTVAIWDWKRKRRPLICYAELTDRHIFGICYNNTDDIAVAVGAKCLILVKTVLTRMGDREIRTAQANFAPKGSPPRY
jgi:hypothetical protein